jgi:hypothetical protein
MPLCQGSVHILRFLRRPILGIAVAFLVAAVAASQAHASGILWRSRFDEAAQESAAQHKPMLVMVKGRWCGPCHKMLNQTFPDGGLASRISQHFVPVLIDADEQAALVKSLGIDALPTVVVISPERRVVGRMTGFQSAAQLNAHLAAYAPREVRQLAVRPAPIQWPVQAAPVAAGPSFLRRHSVAIAPVRPSPAGPTLPPWDTLAAAREFSRRAPVREVTRIDLGPPGPQFREVPSPTPNPPD